MHSSGSAGWCVGAVEEEEAAAACSWCAAQENHRTSTGLVWSAAAAPADLLMPSFSWVMA